MQDVDLTIAALGNEPPLIADGRGGPPDRREISARWLSGTVLTGLTSSILMGVALFAALDGREQLATPPEIAEIAEMAHQGDAGEAARTDRVIPTRIIARARDKRRLEISTVTKIGDRDVVRMMPFIEIKMALGVNRTTTRHYPPFNPLEIFAENGAVHETNTGQIYGAKVDSEVSLKTVDFPLDTAKYDEESALTAAEVEKVVRNTGALLTDGDVQVAALHYVDPQRFGEAVDSPTFAASLGVHIVPENLSVTPKDSDDDAASGFAEEIIPFTTDEDIAKALADSGYVGPDATGMAEAIAKLLNTGTLKAGTVLRVGVETDKGKSRIVRASVYDHTRHLLTIAVDDHHQFVPAAAPEPSPEVAAAFDDSPSSPSTARGDLPTIYDGIYRTAFSYGMSSAMIRQLVKILAPDVDYQSRLAASDHMEVLFSQPESDGSASSDSELLYVSATFGDTTHAFYRFHMKDGTVHYFDKDGRSSRQFLFRNPVPGARLSRGFGMERHPILGVMRMHTGADWAIQRGTPILAAGDGVVEKAGWATGYGREIEIRHANGYETLYAHQSGFAKGIEPGVHVRQGQVIGYVGSSGMSTGPHVHFEIRINHRPVDPLRVRLPVEDILKGPELVAFERERGRIDTLLKEEDNKSLKLASQS